MHRGDLNLNGVTDVADAVKVLRFILQLDTPATDERFRADVNADREVTINDAVLILSRVVGLPDAPP